MEPCLFRHGKDVISHGMTKGTTASMEPCLFRHGKRVYLDGALITTATLQWSHVFSDMVSARWAIRNSINESCFNGAMSFQTW